MEMQPEFSTTVCSHCKRDIPILNVDLHHVHCSRNLERCTICGDMIPKRYTDEHYYNTHALVNCSLCSETVQREVLNLHKCEKCPQRIVTCEYCEIPLSAVDLSKHQEVCGNRTEYCDACNIYVRLQERTLHDAHFHSISDSVAGTSRDERVRGTEGHGRREQGHDTSKRRLLFTIAISGIAVFLGSIFFQRRADANQQL